MHPFPSAWTDPAALRKLGRLLLRLLSVAACVAAWQWASTRHLNLEVVTFQNVPSPRDVFAAALALALTALVARDRFVERPHVFSFLGAVGLLWAVDAVAARRGWAALRAGAAPEHPGTREEGWGRLAQLLHLPAAPVQASGLPA